MKRILSLLIIISILLSPLSAMAVNIPGYEGGIINETTYKEVIFVTGEPIIMEGTLTIKTKEKDNTVSETYSYKLENKALNAKLTRSITLEGSLETKDKQVTTTKTLEKYKESIDVNGKKYEVKDPYYQWNQGSVAHNTPILSYYAGDYSARKTYDVDKGNESVVIETVGNLVGYNGPWSATETQTIEYTIRYENRLTPVNNREGTAIVETSYNKTKDYSYAENIPSQISFNGGYRITEKEENVLKYTYDLPKLNVNTKARNVGTSSLFLDTNPEIKRLNIPALRDVLGHEYEEELLLIASMEGLPLESTMIGPNSSMSRGDFARTIIKAMDIPIIKEEVRRSSRKKVEEPKPLFNDVNPNHRNFDYIEEVAKRNIMVGLDENFNPDKPLSREEAFAIVVRILGFENLAPIKSYSLGYKDEDKVQAWAKDYVYVAKELGFIEKSDYLYPHRDLTKGEAAKLIIDLISYMQDELRYDYREGILNN
ncbi:S-layer homology domain-containing protein [Tissierella sp.]|uniref:S-layer homology domain-containing protein n=1 Tax=Tissierella sp. TaxID=41274 RepID=UPI002856D5D7|nr:S-layer homology domain-containing protein [Tissierella sp.]MDR7857556.1 S-layer homology domain-containing protein [Tissierella sp.]